MGVAEAGSFTKAAAQLNVAQSALSLHVRHMEDVFGTRLFTRDRTGVTPTSAGLKLIHHARIILNQVNLAKEDVTQNQSSPCGEVTVGVPSEIAGVMVTELLSLAAEHLPGVSLRIVEGMSGPVEEWMGDGRLDLAVLYKPVAHSGTALILAREELCLVASPNEPPFEDSVRLTDLCKYPLAVPMRANNVRRLVADVADRHGCALDVRLELDSLSTILSMVTAGKAYSILTPSAIQPEAYSGKLRTVRIVDPPIRRSVVLAVNPRDERLVEVNAVRELIQKVAEKLVHNEKWPGLVAEPGCFVKGMQLQLSDSQAEAERGPRGFSNTPPSAEYRVDSSS